MHLLRSLLLATAAISSSLAAPLESTGHTVDIVDSEASTPATRKVGDLEQRAIEKINIGRYTLYTTHEIGRGAFGVVWAADMKPSNGDQVAVKIQSSHQDLVKGAQRIRAGIKHFTNIIRVISVGDAGPKQVVVMDMADKYDMEQRIQNGMLSRASDIEKAFRGMVNGLVDMHSAGLAHNDAHSGNVVFVKSVPKLTDFDLITRGQYQTKICGRSDILGPEALHLTRSEDIDTYRNDVWSAGVTLLRLMTGRNPWNSAKDDLAKAIWKTSSSRERAHMLKKYFPAISTDLSNVLAKVFCPQSDRYSSNQFYNALRNTPRFFSSSKRMAIRAEPAEDEDDLDTAQNYICAFTPGAPGNGTASNALDSRVATSAFWA